VNRWEKKTIRANHPKVIGSFDSRGGTRTHDPGIMSAASQLSPCDAENRDCGAEENGEEP